MQIILTSRYGCGSGVVYDLIGKKIETLALSEDETLLLVGEILSHIAQGHDITVEHIPE